MYELAQDEQEKNDEVYSFEDVSIVVNPESKEHLDGDIVIDYKQNYGYVLKNSFEILSFGMRLKQK
nr:hypothetical protein [Neobacillus sp. Marseille-Q6967]